MSILDRYILRGLVVNYVIAMAAMLSLYVVLDMFVNMDEFTEHGYPLWTVIGNVAGYYAPNFLLYFAQLSGVIALFACMTTIARMRRLNELTAILSSGVSLYRVAAPVIAFGAATSALLVLDSEFFVPSVAHLLSRNHDEVGSSRVREVLFLQDRDNALLSAANFDAPTGTLHRMLVLTRNEDGKVMQTLEADLATWEPPEPGMPTGRWLLQRGLRTNRYLDESAGLGPKGRIEKTIQRYYESDLSPEDIQMRQAEGWIGFLSLAQLRALRSKGVANASEIVRTKHARIAAPIVSMVLLLLGLPFFLDRSPANVITDAGKCMVACGLCQVTAFISQSIRPETLSALPFWIPIFVFATIATVLIDRIRT